MRVSTGHPDLAAQRLDRRTVNHSLHDRVAQRYEVAFFRRVPLQNDVRKSFVITFVDLCRRLGDRGRYVFRLGRGHSANFSK